MKIKLIISRPEEHWLSEKPVENGYWGFIRCKEDYEKEKATLLQEFTELIDDLKKEGKDFELIPKLFEVSYWDEEQKTINDLKTPESDINICFAVRALPQKALVAASKKLIFFDKVKPNTYWGTLFNPPFYQKLKSDGKSNNVFLVEGSWEKLKKILREF
jgi:hypothetical protein